jgi:hypothetical protein
LPSRHMGPSAEKIARSAQVGCVAEEVDISADYRLGEFVLQTIFELSDPDRDGLPSNEHDVPLAGDILDAFDDAFSLVEAQWGCRDLDRIERLDIRGWLIVAQERERAESRLIRARRGGKANASVSRLSCAAVFSPERRASTSARRARSFSSQISWASMCFAGADIVRSRITRSHDGL